VFGFPVRGLVATSDVIAIVLELALQNTLADVFAGIAVGIEQPYAIGDLVRLDGPIEGEVVEINWRSVQIRTAGNDIATVPNSLVAKSRIINRTTPSARRTDTVQLPCASAVPPQLVMELIRWAILLCPRVLEVPAPAVALIRIGRRSNFYEVSFSVARSNLLWQTKSALLKEVLRQFRAVGIPTVEGEPFEAGTKGIIDMPPASLLDIVLFEGLSQDCRARLNERLVRRALDPRQILFAEGDTEASLFIVATGVLEVSRSNNKPVPSSIGRISAGDYICEIGMLTGTPHAGTVKALTRCVVFELRKASVAALLEAEPQMLHAFEAAARRGQALLDRSVAASVGAETASSGPLLDRMLTFFGVRR
jgi:Mechanosensitive ion channel, beta-domain/Cyclic nucleotide-binding domain